MLAALISAGNAFVRYSLDISSNGWLEIQWYLFAVIVMLGAPLVLQAQRARARRPDLRQAQGNGPVYVDLFGLIFFLMPVMALLA